MTIRGGFSGLIRRGPMAAEVLGRHFVRIYNAAVRDRRLSRRARGLLVEILSHREGWEISEASLIAAGPEGRDAIRTALHELERYGYLHRQQPRDARGRLVQAVFEVTDMPQGLQLGAAAPWETPEEPSEETSSSQPLTENPSTESPQQNSRSEPLTGNPSTAEPSTAEPLHKKTNSSSGGEEHLSLPERTPHGRRGERETAVPHGPGISEATSTPVEAETVVDAYAAALGRPLRNGTRAQLRDQANELLAAGYPVEWLAARAAEMPENGWLDLTKHAERSRAPVPGQAPAPGTGHQSPAARAEIEAAIQARTARASGL